GRTVGGIVGGASGLSGIVRTAPRPGHFIFRPANSSFAWSFLPQLQLKGIGMVEFSPLGLATAPRFVVPPSGGWTRHRLKAVLRTEEGSPGTQRNRPYGINLPYLPVGKPGKTFPARADSPARCRPLRAGNPEQPARPSPPTPARPSAPARQS